MSAGRRPLKLNSFSKYTTNKQKTHKILVRKEIDYSKMSEKEKRQLVSEVNILRELRHPNIVRYYERVVDRERSFIYIIMEWCEGGKHESVVFFVLLFLFLLKSPTL